MPTSAPCLLALFLLARPAAAHDYPIKPVSVVLRAAPDRITADIDSDSIYWIEEVVGLHPMPPNDWPADARAKAETYVNAHFRLSAGGRSLPGRLIAWSYAQRPWEVYEQGRFKLRLEYPSVPGDETLSGQADFFEDYRQERLQEKEPILPIQDFRTIVSVPGFRRFELAPGSSSFSIPVAAARLGAGALLLNGFEAGALAVLTNASGWAALAALALSLAPGAPSRGRAASLLAAAAFGAAVLAAAPNWLPWLAGAAAAAAAGRWLGPGATPGFEAGAAAVLSRYWAFQARPWLPSASPGLLERGAAAAGLLAAGSLIVALGLLAANAERRRLNAVSEARAGDLFERRRRLAATALAIISIFGLAQNFAG